MTTLKEALIEFLKCTEKDVQVLGETTTTGFYNVDDDSYTVYLKETFVNKFREDLKKATEDTLESSDLTFLMPYIDFETCPIGLRTVKKLMYGVESYHEFSYGGKEYAITVE
jgi:hypothetical protein